MRTSQAPSFTFKLIVPVFLFVSIIAGFCSQSQAGYIEVRDGKPIIHVMVWRLPDITNSSPLEHANADVVVLFKKRFSEIFKKKYLVKYKANPKKYGNYDWDNVQVKLDAFSSIKVEGVETDLLAIAGGMAPDVLYVNFRKSDTYIRAGFLYPLDKPEDNYMVGPMGMSQRAKDFRIHPKIMPVINRKGPNGKKHIWAIPYGGALGRVLIYRKDLFDQAGLAYPDENWTWDDLLKACKALTNPEKGIYGMRLGRGKHESWYWMSFLWSAGGEAMTYDEPTDKWTCSFGSWEGAKALDFYTRLSAEKWTDKKGKIRRGYVYKDPSTGYVKWQRGQIGMALSYVDEEMFSTINPEITGMAPVPLGPPDKNGHRMRGAELNSRMMGLFSDIKEVAVRDAAWEYMQFYHTEETVGIRTKYMVEGGMGRFVNPRYLKKYNYPEVIRLSPKGWSRTFNIAIETGKPEPYGKNSNLAYQLMTLPMQEAEQKYRNGELPQDPQERLVAMHEILQKAQALANKEMIGDITPKERKKRNFVAYVAIAVIVLGFGYVFKNIIKTFQPPKIEGQTHVKWGFIRYRWAYILLVPGLLTVFIWQYLPLLRGSFMAFQDYRILGESQWTGVENFGDVIWNMKWWLSMWNALRYSFLVMALTFLPPIILAIFLQEVPFGKIVFRTIYYLPAVVTGLVTILLWKQFYEESDAGALNALMLKLPGIAFVLMSLVLLIICLSFAWRMFYHGMTLAGVCFVIAGGMLFYTCISFSEPIFWPRGETFMQVLSHAPGRMFTVAPEPYRWLSNPKTAMISCVIPMIWAGMGPGCLIYLAALKGIADDFYEAADLDGATFIDKVMFVIFPILKPLIIINFIGAFIQSWYSATGNILVMTGGAAGTEVAGLHIWYKAFTFLKFGPATSMAWILGFMLIGFTVYQLRILSRVEFRTTGDK